MSSERNRNVQPGIIDSHAHLQDSRFADDLEAVLQRAAEAGLERIVCVGYDLPSSREAVALARRYPMIKAVVGIHPHDADTINDQSLAELWELGKLPEVVGVGEMGLDFYRDLSPRDVQRNGFVAQIKLAHELGKPIVIHDRDAHQEVTDIIKQEKAGKNGGIMHCYSGHLPLAVELMKLNFHISFAGPVTYKNAQKTAEVASRIPLDRILVETDCPYLTPEPKRGKRNEPALVAGVVEKIAALQNKTFEEVAYITSRNTKKVFGFQ